MFENCILRIRKYLGFLTCLRLNLSRDCSFDGESLPQDCLSLEVIQLECKTSLDLPRESVRVPGPYPCPYPRPRSPSSSCS